MHKGAGRGRAAPCLLQAQRPASVVRGEPVAPLRSDVAVVLQCVSRVR